MRKSINKQPDTLRLEDVSTKEFTRGSNKNYPIRCAGSDHVKFGSNIVEKVTVIAGDVVNTVLRDANILETEFKQPQPDGER